MILGPRISVSFPTTFGDDTILSVPMMDGRVSHTSPVRLDVRFLRAIITNNGFYPAHDCEVYLKLPKSIPVFESLNWKHWPQDSEWMSGHVNPTLTREQYLQNIQYKYAVNRKVTLPQKIPKLIDIFLVFSDNSAFVIGERQFVFTPPYDDVGELRLTWKGALRSCSKQIKVHIQTWDDVRMGVIDC